MKPVCLGGSTMVPTFSDFKISELQKMNFPEPFAHSRERWIVQRFCETFPVYPQDITIASSTCANTIHALVDTINC